MLFFFTIAIAASGCTATGAPSTPGHGSSPPTPTPTPLPPGPHFYITDGHMPGSIYAYNLPLSSSSTPVLTLQTTGNTPYNPCFDDAGHVVLTFRDTPKIYVYNLPLNGSSTPAYTLSVPGGSVDCHFDGAGNLYVAAWSANSVDVFKAPLTSSSTISSTITTSVNSPWGVFADSAGNVYVSDLTDQTVYSPLSSGNSLQAQFGSQFSPYGIVIGPAGDLYVANEMANNEIDVVHAPFSNSSTPDASKRILMTVTTPTHHVKYISFDSSNNLYAVESDDVDPTFNHIYVFSPPYTGAPLDVNTGTLTLRGGAVGP